MRKPAESPLRVQALHLRIVTVEVAMPRLPDRVAAFLRGRRFAVAGVSRQPSQPANAVFRRLKSAGYEVFPINPRATQVEGTTSYPDVAAIPGQLDGIVIATA